MDINSTLVHMLIKAQFDSRLLDCIIGILFHDLLASSRFTGTALPLIQTKEIQSFDVTAADALTSLCWGGFKGHGGHSLVLIGVGLIRSDNAWGDHRRLC